MIGNREYDLELLIHSIRSAAAGTTYRFGASNIFSKLQNEAKKISPLASPARDIISIGNLSLMLLI